MVQQGEYSAKAFALQLSSLATTCNAQIDSSMCLCPDSTAAQQHACIYVTGILSMTLPNSSRDVKELTKQLDAHKQPFSRTDGQLGTLLTISHTLQL